jgi:hypothetical protein
MERYELRIAEMSDVVREIDRLWEGLQSDEPLQEDARDAGLDVSRFAGIKRADALVVSTVAHGITGAELFDVTAVSAVSAMHVVFYDMWKRVILPRLQQRFGKDAIKEHVVPKAMPEKRPRAGRKSKPPPRKKAKARKR